jgi:hypothetical protein
VIDLNDVLAILGIVALHAGVAWLSPPAALILGGVTLIIIGVLRARWG